MNRLYHIFTCSLTSTFNDVWLLRLASWSVGVGVLVLVAITLPRHASSQTELSLGLGLAVLNCLISIMYGTLAPRAHLAGVAMKWPWRSRVWEWGGYTVGVAIFALGLWFTSTLSLNRVGFISAFLLILATTLATFCLGLLFTLLRHSWVVPVPATGFETGAQEAGKRAADSPLP